jgi:transcriptional regulator with XRE-family HTH domain
MDLGKKLYELRKSKNLSQEAVAEQLNVTRQTVSKWETNQSTPDFDKILPICELYEISTDELIKDESQKEQKEQKEQKDERIENKKIIYENMTKNEINQKSAEVVSSSILIFIIAIAFAAIGVTVLRWNAVVVGCTFLILIGYGITRMIKHYMSIPKFEKTKEEKKQDTLVTRINNIVKTFGIAIYFIVSFETMDWEITWIIFIIIKLIEEIVKLVFLLKGAEINEEDE